MTDLETRCYTAMKLSAAGSESKIVSKKPEDLVIWKKAGSESAIVSKKPEQLYIYIYVCIYMCVCVCVCVCNIRVKMRHLCSICQTMMSLLETFRSRLLDQQSAEN
jgi:hypothetical protein